MNVIRTFVAVLISENLKDAIAQVQEQVKDLAPNVKWVARENFHVTLKFLGNVREDALAGVCAAVEDAALLSSPFDLSLSGLGAFPSPARARVVWVAADKGRQELTELAAAVDAGLARLGYEKDDKPFKAHITIGRVKTSGHTGRLAEGIETVDAANLGTQRVESVAVMKSDLLRDGPVYSSLRVIDLQQGE